MKLHVGDHLVTFGPQLKVKKNSFQGIVVKVADLLELPNVVGRIASHPRLRKYQHFPRATRIRKAGLTASEENNQESREYTEKLTTKAKYFRPIEETGICEDWEDDGEVGVGDRLLHLLQRWQVENVLLLVARQDDSLSGRLIGPELYKLMLESGKLALEQYFMDSMKPSDAAKLELLEAAAAKGESPREPGQTQGQHPSASVCLMTSDTIPSWPKQHQPTADGGGRKGVKKGRVNHFMHQLQQPSSSSSTDLSVDKSHELQQQQLQLQDDITHATGGIDWLGISRDEWLKLKSIRVPVKELHYLFMCLVILLEKPPEKIIKAKPTPKQQEQFTPANFSWIKCREILHHSPNWSDRLRVFHGSMLTKSQVMALRAVFQEPGFNESAFVRISVASVKIFTWLQHLLDDYDEMELGLRDHDRQFALEEQAIATSVSSPLHQPQQLQPHPPPAHAADTRHRHIKNDQHSSFFTLNQSPPSQTLKIIDKGRLFTH